MDKFAGTVDMIQIGAREHTTIPSKEGCPTGKPILLKRHFAATLVSCSMPPIHTREGNERLFLRAGFALNPATAIAWT